MSLKIFPYKLGSVSAKRLARTLGTLRVSASYNARRKDVIVNWGNSSPPHFRWMEQDLNKPHAIALASNKLNTFLEFRNTGFIHVPDWTTNPQEAQHLLDLGTKVYCRKLLSSHSGNGIVVCNDGDRLPIAPLYTFHTKHKHEYRVHVFRGKVIDVQMKRSVMVPERAQAFVTMQMDGCMPGQKLPRPKSYYYHQSKLFNYLISILVQSISVTELLIINSLCSKLILPQD